MKSWKTLIAATLAALLPVVIQAQTPDPVVGTWQLNVAKSKYDPGPAPKSQMRTYTQTAEGTKVVIKGESPSGAALASESTFTYDGKPHAVIGLADYDAIAVKRINQYATETDLILKGKVIGKLQRVESKDGKTLTVTVNMTTANGASEHDVAIYDRQ
jgi:hypothetical protein